MDRAPLGLCVNYKWDDVALHGDLGGIDSPLCEMCGTERPRLNPVSVEGTRLMLCENCAKFGVAIGPSRTSRTVRPAGRPKSTAYRPIPPEEEYDLASDLQTRIRKAREAKGWKREELARKINEKLSIIEKLEKGDLRPDDKLVSKLEKALGIGLRERVEEARLAKKEKGRPLTLGDLIKRRS